MPNPTETQHVSNDELLTLLAGLEGPIGSFVSSYPGIADAETYPDWLDDWFRLEIETAYQVTTDPDKIEFGIDATTLTSIGALSASVVTTLRLIDVRPHFFRGFRNIETPVNLDGQLVVIDGKNSTGKTSISEAIEWLLTGQLERRIKEDQGNPQELENFVQCQMRPTGETTSVEAHFEFDGGEKLRLKRVLKTDYGTTKNAFCTSTLYVDDHELSETDENVLIEEHFASCAPLLMQHTLRDFIHRSPTERRDYFERLLQMNELTTLIEKAVIGSSHLPTFVSPTGSKYYPAIDELKGVSHSAPSRKAIREILKADTSAEIESALLSIAMEEFSLAKEEISDFKEALEFVKEEQKKARATTFPILQKLKPSRTFDDAAKLAIASDSTENIQKKIRAALETLDLAHKAVEAFGKAEVILGPALQKLMESNEIDADLTEQDCPLCEAPNSLKKVRIESVLSVEPLSTALNKAKQTWATEKLSLKTEIERVIKTVTQIIPIALDDSEWQVALEKIKGGFETTATKTKTELAAIDTQIKPLRTSAESIISGIASLEATNESVTKLESDIETFATELKNVTILAPQVAMIILELEKAVGEEAGTSADYSFREKWLFLSENTNELLLDIKWEKAKTSADDKLKKIRDHLIEFRQSVLESRRESFSNGMSEIWSTLRKDSYSKFKGLSIPVPKGKGFPISIQVLASLDDGTVTKDVDALRVFSESQTNALGIAAFLTKMELIGVRFVILDDPVQSMDDDHFKTLARDLLPVLLEKGFQVIVLTHNDKFAHDISYAHSEREEYITLGTRSSKRLGCVVDEGNRRICERLKTAEKMAEESDFDAAWSRIRFATERLYKLVKKKADPTFDESKWYDATAEYMWDPINGGVGTIIEEAVPGSGKRLKEILIETAEGAHDKESKGETEIKEACSYIRSLLTPLRCGD